MQQSQYEPLRDTVLHALHLQKTILRRRYDDVEIGARTPMTVFLDYVDGRDAVVEASRQWSVEIQTAVETAFCSFPTEQFNSPPTADVQIYAETYMRIMQLFNTYLAETRSLSRAYMQNVNIWPANKILQLAGAYVYKYLNACMDCIDNAISTMNAGLVRFERKLSETNQGMQTDWLA